MFVSSDLDLEIQTLTWKGTVVLSELAGAAQDLGPFVSQSPLASLPLAHVQVSCPCDTGLRESVAALCSSQPSKTRGGNPCKGCAKKSVKSLSPVGVRA